MKKYIVKLVYRETAVFYLKKMDNNYDAGPKTRTKDINEALRFDSYEIAWLVGLVYGKFSMHTFDVSVEEAQ